MCASRRQFLTNTALLAAGALFTRRAMGSGLFKTARLQVSLAQWSLHKSLFSKKLDNLDFPAYARKQFGITTVEYVNQFFKDKANDTAYLAELLKRCKDNGITNHLIMIDGEGGLGETDSATRKGAVEAHYKWVDAAKFLGCKTIRVNAHGTGAREAVHAAAVDGLGRLGEYGGKVGINIIVENHGGYSSDGKWLSGVIRSVNRKNVGTLPDFGNFCIRREGNNCVEEYDRYKGVKELLPYAKGVSAKTYDFDQNGSCTETDYSRIMKLIKAGGFSGVIGIEYEGDKLGEDEGILKTKALILREAKKLGIPVTL